MLTHLLALPLLLHLIHKILLFSSLTLQPVFLPPAYLPLETSLLFLLGSCSWLFAAATFLFACVLFWKACSLQVRNRALQGCSAVQCSAMQCNAMQCSNNALKAPAVPSRLLSLAVCYCHTPRSLGNLLKACLLQARNAEERSSKAALRNLVSSVASLWLLT